MNEVNSYLQVLVFPILLAIPLTLVTLVGIGISLFRYKKAPRASILAISGLLLFLLLRLVFAFQPLLNVWMVEGNMEPETFTYIIGGISIVSSLIGAISLALLVFAVWSNRD